MKREELIRALRHMAAETGSLACLGCGYEHSCSIRGCAIIKEAIEELRKMDLPSNPPMTLEELREMDGEFVWVERSCNDWHDFCAWAFVHKKHYVCRPVAGPELFFDDYGTTWRAYRRKPEELPLAALHTENQKGIFTYVSQNNPI